MQVEEPSAAALGEIEKELKEDCPFREQPEGVDNVEGEDVSRDDLTTQENNGGKLGDNLLSASFGTSGTWSGNPTKYQALRMDTKRAGMKVRVPAASGSLFVALDPDRPTSLTPMGNRSIGEGEHGFTAAAHHLIPGDASLARSILKPLMTKDETVEIQVVTPTGTLKKKKTIRKHVGYNVNGCHNGVWLPGNYYVRKSTSPISGISWGRFTHSWQLSYVAAVCRATGSQFHDAHTQYNDAVKDLLDKIAGFLLKHECEFCKEDKINPPYKIKGRLYNLSTSLRGKLESGPVAWQRPWFTSDRWRDEAFAGTKPSKGFMDSYNNASVVLPNNP